jgi:P63C domain
MKNKDIQSMGGKARDAALSDEQKTEIARKAAVARWGEKPLRATNKGNFVKEFGIDVECYVVDDVLKTAVISQKGMGRVLGLSPRGNAFPRFLSSKAMVNTIGAQLHEKLTQPIKFQWVPPGAQEPGMTVHGFDVTLLIDVCKAIVQVESKLDRQQKHVAVQAHVILAASAKAGIKGLVYALAGYNPTAQEVITAFKTYVQEEARKYEPEFPTELYAEWYRLYQIPPLTRGKPWQFKHLTVNHVYYPLAKSSGKILQLLRANKADGGPRQKKLFQFLNEIGTRALRIHLGRVLEMAESAGNKAAYEAKIAERFSGQAEFPFVYPDAPPPDKAAN